MSEHTIDELESRRPALVGLLRLAVYAEPLALFDTEQPVWLFVPRACGYLRLLFADQDERIRGWGRRPPTAARPARVATGSRLGGVQSVMR